MSIETSSRSPSLTGRFYNWAHRVRLERKLAIILVAAAMISGIATYFTLTGSFAPREPGVITALLILDCAFLLALGVILAWRLVKLWMERKRGLAGARLHARLVLVFSLVAVTPTIIIAVFSTLFLNIGMEGWFSNQVRVAVRDSLVVAQAYVAEHQRSVGAELVNMANDIRREAPSSLDGSVNQYRLLLDVQARLRRLDEAAIVDGRGNVIVLSGYSLALSLDPEIPQDALARAREGQVVQVPVRSEDRVRALVQLDPLDDTFLYVGRLIDPRIVNHLDTTEGAARLYEKLEGSRDQLQIALAGIFFVIALLVLFGAIWVALTLASHIVDPLGRLVAASDRVGQGDLDARVPGDMRQDEIGGLLRAFNRMMQQLRQQRSALHAANRQIEERHRFTEAVLAGVSAGVIGLDRGFNIHLPNRAASELLGLDLQAHRGQDMRVAVPEMADILNGIGDRINRTNQGMVVRIQAGVARSFVVRVVAEAGREDLIGYVVTFDDITELQLAQRKAAWADVARRIAHEIKNPLTPIQLSAERLKRKYLKEIKSDPDTFTICTDTIVRQVGDIGRMVDEFSAFARMPVPVMQDEDLAALCHQTVFLQKSAHPDIDYHEHYPQPAILWRCDGRLVGQAITNLLKNAAEAIESRDSAITKGRIDLAIKQHDAQSLEITVSDNGKGLPAQDRDRLTEPYMTTRVKGTGLGLAIVKKIAEDHGGSLTLTDNPGGGAIVSLLLRTAALQGAGENNSDGNLKLATAHGT